MTPIFLLLFYDNKKVKKEERPLCKCDTCLFGLEGAATREILDSFSPHPDLQENAVMSNPYISP